MKKLSDARIEAMALGVAKQLEATPGIEILDRGAAVKNAVAALSKIFQGDPELDKAVRARIASLSRGVEEGSREWDLLYRQYSDELAARRR